MEEQLTLIEDRQTVVKLIEQYRTQKGLTWAAMASLFRVSTRTLERWRQYPDTMPVVAFVAENGDCSFGAMMVDGNWNVG